MKIRMYLISDTIWGNGLSSPGEEDLSVQMDQYGFPYYRGSTFKGIFREELSNLLFWKDEPKEKVQNILDSWLGSSGDNDLLLEKIKFFDFTLSDFVKQQVMNEIAANNPEEDHFEIVKRCTTSLRTFTALNEDGSAKENSLRVIRCINHGLFFYSDIICQKEQESLVREVLSQIKWIGTMRNRGFGKVKIEVM